MLALHFRYFFPSLFQAWERPHNPRLVLFTESTEMSCYLKSAVDQ